MVSSRWRNWLSMGAWNSPGQPRRAHAGAIDRGMARALAGRLSASRTRQRRARPAQPVLGAERACGVPPPKPPSFAAFCQGFPSFHTKALAVNRHA
jgi:hypothetical protein